MSSLQSPPTREASVVQPTIYAVNSCCPNCQQNLTVNMRSFTINLVTLTPNQPAGIPIILEVPRSS